MRPLHLFEVQKIINNVVYNVQSLVFKVPLNIKRDDLVKFLKENEVETTIGTYCLSGTTYYKNKYNDVQLLSYAVKYASNFYGPFREAVGSIKSLKSDKKSSRFEKKSILFMGMVKAKPKTG